MEDVRLKDYVKTGNIFSVRKTWEARANMGQKNQDGY